MTNPATETDRGTRSTPVAELLALVNHLRGEGFTVIDANRHEPLAGVESGRQPHTLAVHHGGRWGYVPYMGSNSLEVIDLAAARAGNGGRLPDAVDRVTPGTPTAFTDATPDGAVLAIDAYEDDRITFLDPATLDVVARVRTGETSHYPRFSADGRVRYVPNTAADTMAVPDTASLRDDGRAPLTATIELSERSAPSGRFRTDRRDSL